MKKMALYLLSIAVVLGIMSPQLTSAKGLIITHVDNVDKKAKHAAVPFYPQKPNVLEEIAQSKSPIGDNTVPIKEAVVEFEKKNQKNIFLPKHIPFESTHTGAIYDDTSEKITLIYYNQHTYDHMKVDIYPQRENPRRKINSRHNEVSLADGTKALYVHDDRQIADFIIFTKDGLEYRIGISKRMHEVKFETLSKVAESIIS